MQSTMHVYKVRPRKDSRGVDLISDALPFGRLWDGKPNAVANAIGSARGRTDPSGQEARGVPGRGSPPRRRSLT